MATTPGKRVVTGKGKNKEHRPMFSPEEFMSGRELADDIEDFAQSDERVFAVRHREREEDE